MLKKRYITQLEKYVKDALKGKKGTRAFLFGSSVSQDKFGDVDIAVLGNVSEKDLNVLRETLQNSNFPYFVDIVHLNKADKSFKDNILNSKIIWIKH